MARINIEDSVFKEKSFEKLMLKLGSRREAIGALVEAFMLAQKHYLTTVNDRLIPFNDWQREEIGEEIIECGFAERRDNGIYVRGSDEQFGWLIQRSEAGKASARIKAEKKSTTVQRPSTTVNGSQPLTLSPSLSPSLPLPLSLSKNREIEKNEKKPSADSANAEIGKQVSSVIAKYCELWKAKYKTNVSFSNKWAGNAKTLVKDHGVQKALSLVDAFMEMNDTWFISNRHSFELILVKLASINHYAGTGVQITQTQLNQHDKSLANKTAGEGAAAHFRKGGTS